MNFKMLFQKKGIYGDSNLSEEITTNTLNTTC